MEQALFWILSVGTVLSTLAVVVPPFGRNPIHAALSLVVSFVFMAGLYALLVAHLLAALQVLIYAGAIMVLFVFVIMLLNLREADFGDSRMTVTKIVGGLALLFIFGRLWTFITNDPALKMPGADLSTPAMADFGTIGTVGQLLYKDFMIPFELTSILLLVAVIGSLVMAKRNL
jgi:NADH-quinone oxidoreductase subunit J